MQILYRFLSNFRWKKTRRKLRVWLIRRETVMAWIFSKKKKKNRKWQETVLACARVPIIFCRDSLKKKQFSAELRKNVTSWLLSTPASAYTAGGKWHYALDAPCLTAASFSLIRVRVLFRIAVRHQLNLPPILLPAQGCNMHKWAFHSSDNSTTILPNIHPVHLFLR